ncbi:hypothetical protein Tco_0892530 [Tanacetum coccineum]|uniref:Integrase, catalytic region, zinc finger, CCHC-type, peptidase aspartic, catalytic n=1 Tax=Tanacetum coccineum TaxID=301880 RepID=A0ABQ5C983_9ASTR
MDERTKNYLFAHILAGSNPSILVDKTKSAGDWFKTAHTTSGANEESGADDISRKVKLEDLSYILKDTTSAFFTPDSPTDESIIVSDVSEEEENAENDKDTKDTSSQKEELEQAKVKAKAEVASIKAKPLYPDINQLTKLLVTSLKPKLSKVLASHDFASCLPTELKELPSKIIGLSGEIKELKQHIKDMEIKLPMDLIEIPTKLESFTSSISSHFFPRFSTVMENASRAVSMNVPTAGQEPPSPAEGEKNTKDASTNLKNELIDLLGKDVVTQLGSIFTSVYAAVQKLKKDSWLELQFSLAENSKMNVEAAKFVRDFKSLAKEANEFLGEHKALEFEIDRLLKAVVSQDIMSIVQSNSVVDTSNIQTELDQSKCDKISYDKAYNDMQQKIKWLQAQLGDQKGKSKDTSCVSDTLDPLSQKLENENVELDFPVLNYANENEHLKTTYKILFDSINVTRAQTKTITDSLQQKLHDTIYENAKLRAQLFDKVSEQKDTTKGTSTNTKFANQSTKRKPSLKSLRNNFVVKQPNAFQSERPNFSKTRILPKVVEMNDLSNQVTSNLENKFVPINQAKARVDNTAKTRRPQLRSNTKNDRVIQICLWCVDLGCSEHMTGNLKLFINFVWKFLGTARFGNDHIAAILDLEVAFRGNTCFIKNLEGVELFKGNRTKKLYTINLHDIASASPICLMARAMLDDIKDTAITKAGTKLLLHRAHFSGSWDTLGISTLKASATDT